MAGDKTYITDSQGKLHRATRVHAVTPTDIVWSSNPNDYTVQVKIDGKWHRAVLTMDAGSSTFFDNINIDKALVSGADGKQHTALIVKPESTVTLSDIKTDTHGTIAGTTTGETAVSTYSENWSDVKWQDNVNVYKVLVTGSDGKVHTALLTTSTGGGTVQAIVLGPSPLLLPDAVANSLSYVKAFGGTEQRNIPQPYTQVNYVTNTASTAVNTGIMIDFAKNYEFEVECRAVSGSWYILQSRASSSGNITGIHGATSGSTITLVVGNVTVCTSAITRTVGNKLYVKATLNAGTATLYVKDETANTEDTQTGSYGTSQPNPTASVYLLGNAGGQYVDVNSDIYMVRIKENDTVVMDYVPARQAATAGFYDKASGTFKTATAGTFAAGPETVPTPDVPMDIVSNNGVLKYGQYGKNLYDKSDDIIGKILNDSGSIVNENNGFYSANIPVSPNTTYTVSQNSTTGGIYLRVLEYNNADAMVKLNKGTTAGVQNQTFTTSATTKYVIISGLNSGRDTLQLELGNQATEYEPYHFGIHADGTVETINAHGKNLFDKNTVDQNFVNGKIKNASGTEINDSTSSYSTTFIKVLPSTPYTFSWVGGAAAIQRIYYYTENKQWISRTPNTFGYSPASFTTPNNCAYIQIQKATSAYNNSTNFQLEKGSTATTYAPYYDGGTATAEMLLKVGDYQDEQEILSGAVTRSIRILVLTGDETWTRQNPPSGKTFYTYNLSLDSYSGAGDLPNVPYCTHLQRATATGRANIPDNGIGVSVNTPYTTLWLRCDTYESITDWTNFLKAQYAAGTPVIIAYPLATPTTESVTGQTLQVTSGDNVLEITQASLTGLELEAEYTKVE